MHSWSPNDRKSIEFLNQVRRLEDPATWRRNLARLIAELCESDHAVVATCQIDRPGVFQPSAWPVESEPFVQRVNRDYLPLFYEDPSIVAEVLRVHGPVVSIFKAFTGHPIQPELIEMHRAEGVGDYAGTWLMIPSGVCGFVLVGAALGSDTDALLAARRERILWLAGESAQAIQLAIAMAEGLGVGADRSRPDLRASVGLTARQQEIVELVVSGLMDVNIAARLGIQESTVGTHLHTIYRRLGVHSRAQLIGRVATWFDMP